MAAAIVERAKRTMAKEMEGMTMKYKTFLYQTQEALTIAEADVEMDSDNDDAAEVLRQLQAETALGKRRYQGIRNLVTYLEICVMVEEVTASTEGLQKRVKEAKVIAAGFDYDYYDSYYQVIKENVETTRSSMEVALTFREEVLPGLLLSLDEYLTEGWRSFAYDDSQSEMELGSSGIDSPEEDSRSSQASQQRG